MTSKDSSRAISIKFLSFASLIVALIGFTYWTPTLHQHEVALFERIQGIFSQLTALPESGEASLGQWLAIAFTTVFIAEMGDKTQLATMLMSARGQSPWSIFLGSASALVAASLVSVTIGGWLSTLVSPKVLQAIAGVSFILLGLYVLWAEMNGVEAEASELIENNPVLETGGAEESDGI